MDDVAVPLIGPSHLILGMVRDFYIVAAIFFHQFMFKMNYKAGKSNANVRIAGAGAREAYLALAENNFVVKCNCAREELMWRCPSWKDINMLANSSTPTKTLNKIFK